MSVAASCALEMACTRAGLYAALFFKAAKFLCFRQRECRCPPERQKVGRRKREVKRGSKNSRDGGVGGGAVKQESRRAQATEAEALFVEN